MPCLSSPPSRRVVGAMAALATLLAAGFGLGAGDAAASTFPTPGGCASANPTGHFHITMKVGPSIRSALVDVPPAGASGRRLPLVFAFHGAGGSGSFMEAYTGLSEVGARHGFIIVYPDALYRFWQLSGPDRQGNDDIAFTRALLEALDRQLCVDDDRVYATGVSNGGGLTARVGCELSDRFAAIAPVAGGYRSLPPCHPVRALSVLEIHGTADASVPYDGRPPERLGSVMRFLDQWTALDACPVGPPSYRRFARRAQLLTRDGCAGETSVWHIRLMGGPHIWPGTPFVKRDRKLVVPIAASQEIWRFFAAHPRPYIPPN
ncbi:MAG: PHB depolymerase family esterase [Thermoleophilaceae bacterium]